MAFIEEYLEGLKKCLEELSVADIEQASDLIFEAYNEGNRLHRSHKAAQQIGL